MTHAERLFIMREICEGNENARAYLAGYDCAESEYFRGDGLQQWDNPFGDPWTLGYYDFAREIVEEFE